VLKVLVGMRMYQDFVGSLPAHNWKFGFNPKQLHVGFVVDRVVLRQVFHQVLSVSI